MVPLRHGAQKSTRSQVASFIIGLAALTAAKLCAFCPRLLWSSRSSAQGQRSAPRGWRLTGHERLRPAPPPQRAGPEGVLLVTGSEEQPFWGRTQVVFDIMGTVVRDPFREVAPKFFGISEAELWESKNESAWLAFERGDIDETELRATYFKDGRNFDVDGLKTALIEGYEFIDGMPELLRDLRAVGHKLHGFSNYPEWYTHIEEKLGIEAKHGLQWTCVSCDTGLRKPEPPSFLNLLRRLGVGRRVGAAPVLFIDDSSQNCASAERVGICSVQFNNAVELRKALASTLGSRKEGTAPEGGWPERVMR